MKSQTKTTLKKFERQAGPQPALKRAAPAPAETAGAGEPAGQPAADNLPGDLSQKEVLLRLVETLKAL